MQIPGLILVVVSLALAFLGVMTRAKVNVSFVAVCVLGVFAGIALTLQDRITELTFTGVGTIKAASEQAVIDAKTISDLRQRVENQSATVDLVAKQASSARVLSEQVEEQNRRAAEKLDALDTALGQASASLTEVRSASDFMQTVIAAQNDDRNAFDKLEQLAKDKSEPFSANAERAWITILEAHASALSLSGFTIPWKEGIDPSKFSLAELAQQYARIPVALKPALLEYVWNRQDISKLDRLDFLMHVMKTDTSLTAVEYAGRYFTAGSGQAIKPLAVTFLSGWWNQHRLEFVGK